MDNRDLQSQLDKASQESGIKPFTIQDLIRFAERDGINCENCANWQYKETLVTEIGICYKGGYTLEGRQTIRLEAKHHFCNSFKQKDK
jgi:hypothetical protein